MKQYKTGRKEYRTRPVDSGGGKGGKGGKGARRQGGARGCLTGLFVLIALGLLGIGIALGAASMFKETLMVEAARAGLTPAVEILARAGASPDGMNARGDTPLAAAAARGWAETVGRLLWLGADASLARADGTTPLMVASRFGHPTIVSTLIEAGADPGAVNVSGETAMHMAAYGGSPQAMDTLLRAGADPGARDSLGYTPLRILAASGNDGLVARLIGAGAAPDPRDNNGATPLMVASWALSSRTVSELLRGGARPQEKDDAGNGVAAYLLGSDLRQARRSEFLATYGVLVEAGMPRVDEVERELAPGRAETAQGREARDEDSRTEPQAPPEPSAPRRPALSGMLLHDGRPIGEFTQARPNFWFRNETTGQEASVVHEYAGGVLALYGLEEGRYGVSVSINANEGNAGGYPGDYSAWKTFDIPYAGGGEFSIDLYRVIHLVSPVDNGYGIEGWGEACERMPQISPTLTFRWEGMGPEVEYRYELGGQTFTTRHTELSLLAPREIRGTCSEFRLLAYREGRLIGQMLTHGKGGGLGWSLVLRVAP